MTTIGGQSNEGTWGPHWGHSGQLLKQILCENRNAIVIKKTMAGFGFYLLGVTLGSKSVC